MKSAPYKNVALMWPIVPCVLQKLTFFSLLCNCMFLDTYTKRLIYSLLSWLQSCKFLNYLNFISTSHDCLSSLFCHSLISLVCFLFCNTSFSTFSLYTHRFLACVGWWACCAGSNEAMINAKTCEMKIQKLLRLKYQPSCYISLTPWCLCTIVNESSFLGFLKKLWKITYKY